MNKQECLDAYKLFAFGKGGIGCMFGDEMHAEVEKHLLQLGSKPISKVQLNQLFVISKIGSVSDGFFDYYWKSMPSHTYDLSALEFHSSDWKKSDEHTIISHDHFRSGLYRLYVDGLLYFGNVQAGFDALRSLSRAEITEFFERKCFDTKAISTRGPALPLQMIAKDDRYLISEMACKTFGELPEDSNAARDVLGKAYEAHVKEAGGPIQFKELLSKLESSAYSRDQLLLSYDDVLNDEITNDGVLTEKHKQVLDKFLSAREKAVANTSLYLSMVNDLDVYVATSMRSRKNFRDMAEACEAIFSDKNLLPLHLRHFDPTLSAAKGHEDKGLIECLMVKCAKVLVYCEGEKESYGKDAEAAMALSLGKPVIFYCDHGVKTAFYRDVHPLARLIDFRTGVAVGAIVSDDVTEVAQILLRIFTNTMAYRIEHHPKRPGYLKLIESLTQSVVRLQTDDLLLESTFWNNYHNRRKRYVSVAAGKEAERLQE